MVNPSSLLNPAGALIDAAAAAIEGGAGHVRRSTVRPASRPPANPIDFLLDPRTARRVGRALGALVARGRRTGVRGWAPAPAPSTSRSSGSSKAGGDFAFLSDPKLTIEEKLMRLLAALSERWEKEMQSKMDQIAADDQMDASGSGGSSSAKKGGSKKSGGGLLGGIGDVFSGIMGGGGSGGGGLFGGIGDLLSGVLGGIGGIGGAGGGGGLGGLFDVLEIPGVKDVLEKVSGPVLAAAASALGFPMAAPLLMKLGPALVEGAAGFAATSGEGRGGSARSSGSTRSSSSRSTRSSSSSRSSGSGSGSSSSSSATGDKKMSDSQRQLLMMEIQRIYERQKEMFGVVSNIMKASHDTRMNSINNLR